MSKVIELDFRYLTKEIYLAYYLHYKDKIKATRDFIIGFIGIIATLMLMKYFGESYILIVALIFSIVILSVPILAFIIIPLFKLLKLNMTCKLIVNEDYVVLERKKNSFKVLYSKIIGLKENEKFILIYKSSQNFMILPKRIFNNYTEIAKLRKILKEKLKFASI